MYPGSCTSTSSRRVQSQPYCRLRVRLRCSVPLDRLTWPSVVTSARSSFVHRAPRGQHLCRCAVPHSRGRQPAQHHRRRAGDLDRLRLHSHPLFAGRVICLGRARLPNRRYRSAACLLCRLRARRPGRPVAGIPQVRLPPLAQQRRMEALGGGQGYASLSAAAPPPMAPTPP